MALKGSQHTLMIRKNLRNAHIMNKSYIVPRKSYIANAFSNAFALAFRIFDLPCSPDGGISAA